MVRPLPLPPPGFDDLTMEEKLDYLQSLWNRIAARPEDVPVPDWHRRILDERLAEYRANPEEGEPWEDVYADLLKKLRER